MKLTFITTFTLGLIFYITCTTEPIRKRKGLEPGEYIENKKSQHKHVYGIANPTKIVETIPYQEIHIKMHGDNFEGYKSWPELANKSGPELVDYCNRYLRCFQMRDRVRESALNSKIFFELKLLRYYIRDRRIQNRPPIFHKTRLVLVLMCRLTPKIIRRFIEAADGYSAFYVLKTNSSGNLFTIVDACPTHVLNKMALEPDKIKCKPHNCANSKMIEKAASYHEIHANMYGDNFDLYKRWPELERKNEYELTVLCYKYIKCTGIKIGCHTSKWHSVMDTKMIRYYGMKMIISDSEDTSYIHHYKNRLVRSLNCQIGSKIYRFVQAIDKFSVFHIMHTTNSYDLFTIVNACPMDILNAINEQSSDECIQ